MDQDELKGIYFQSENNNQSHFFIHIKESEKNSNATVEIFLIDSQFSVSETYSNLDNGAEITFFPFEINLFCKLQLWGKYFYPIFTNDYQFYYDDVKYYDGKTKTDYIQSMADVINFAIEYGLKTTEIKPY